MTVVIEIDGEQYEGSGVQRLQMNYSPKYGSFHSAKTTSTHSRSEAVIIDLGEHGYAFALWPYDYPDRFAKAYPTKYLGEMPKIKGKDTPAKRAKAYKTYLNAISHSENQVSLHPSKTPNYPVFVAFKNLKKPRSISRFHIDATRNTQARHDEKQFNAFFGGNAWVVSVMVTNTKDAANLNDLENVLGVDFFERWHKNAHGRNPDGQCWNDNFNRTYHTYCSMAQGDFKRYQKNIGQQ